MITKSAQKSLFETKLTRTSIKSSINARENEFKSYLNYYFSQS